ncbi:hypothetical protein NPIL_600611 [Nephila pilipes]|uniref:Uncharacterized protein n=1 Tax=Nephila pilipes TaxID=299642 RepID=A0A8X6U4F8_NEPPI|nr:hypothetical protein NPIL_290921 [Nephila pilipes]GFT90473.1 hypothetical protein NPIL_600611 [Nephila pilipes]
MSVKTLYRHLKLASDIPIRCPLCNEHMTVHHFLSPPCLGKSSFAISQTVPFLQRRGTLGVRRKKSSRQCEACGGMLKTVRDYREGRIAWMEDETEEEEEEEEEMTSAEVCDCKKFESTPHQMLGRRKERMNEYVGFYDSLFENPDWWRCDDPVEFTEASGKDVYGIL